MTEHSRGIGSEVRARLEPRLQQFSILATQPNLLDRIAKFAELLAVWGSRMNLTAKPNDPADLAFHVLDSLMPLALHDLPQAAALKPAFAKGSRVLDLGSGAGFPGLILAAASEAEFVLVESRRKRASFLSIAAAELGLDNTTILAKRVTTGDFSANFNLATARALGAPAEFYELCAAALMPDGHAMLYASPSQRLDLSAANEAGFSDYRKIPYSVPADNGPVKRVIALWRKT
jgi:16S rRNA (guanine527-N7)-methyltransferase